MGWHNPWHSPSRLPGPADPCRTAASRASHGNSGDECLNEQWFETLQQARSAITLWRQDYNQRPGTHSSCERMPLASSPRYAIAARWRCNSIQLNDHRDPLIRNLGLPRYEWHGKRGQVNFAAITLVRLRGGRSPKPLSSAAR
ncbi:MAG: transposase [Simplicispira sp.]|nr:transposase [Simplicispira sp.]